MLTVNLITIGKLKEKYLQQAIAEYAKRLTAFCKFNIIELPESKTDNIEEEGALILAKLPRGYTIAMAIDGNSLSSPQLAKKFAAVAQTSSTLNILIGGSNGLSDKVLQSADYRLSVSAMTFPHQLFRLIITEQIYRAFAINNGSKYHK